MYDLTNFSDEAVLVMEEAKRKAEQMDHSVVTNLHVLWAIGKFSDDRVNKILRGVYVSLPFLLLKAQEALDATNSVVRAYQVRYSRGYELTVDGAKRNAQRLGRTTMVYPEYLLWVIRTISSEDGCDLLNEMFGLGSLRAEILSHHYEVIEAHLCKLQEAVGIDTPEEAIVEAVRRLKVDAEYLSLVHELRILLGASSDAEALQIVISKESSKWPSEIVSGQPVGSGSIGY